MLFLKIWVRWIALLTCLFGFAACQESLVPEPELSDQNIQDLTEQIKWLDSSVTCERLDALVRRVGNVEAIPEFYRRKLWAQQAVCSVTPGTDINRSAYEMTKAAGIWADLSEDVVTLYAKSTTASEPQLCCAIQKAVWGPIGDIEDKIWKARLRLKEADRASLMFMDTSGTNPDFSPLIIQGENADIVDVPFLSDPAIKLSGTFEQRQISSSELGETRTVSIYTAKGKYDPNAPVIILADGISLGYYARMIDPMIEQGLIKPVNFMGIHSERDSISEALRDLPKDPRASDYLPGYDKDFPDRFDNHMEFIFETALPTLFPSSENSRRLAVGGHSNGAVFSVHAGVRNPNLVDAVLSVSGGFGGLKAAQECSEDGANFYISAGVYEPSFLASTEVTEQTLKAQGCNTRATYHPVGHDPGFFRTELYRFLLAEFGNDL